MDEAHCSMTVGGLHKLLFLSALDEDELEPARKKRREQLAYLESEEFQKILKAKSKHTEILKEVRVQKIKDGRAVIQTRSDLLWD